MHFSLSTAALLCPIISYDPPPIPNPILRLPVEPPSDPTESLAINSKAPSATIIPYNMKIANHKCWNLDEKELQQDLEMLGLRKTKVDGGLEDNQSGVDVKPSTNGGAGTNEALYNGPGLLRHEPGKEKLEARSFVADGVSRSQSTNNPNNQRPTNPQQQPQSKIPNSNSYYHPHQSQNPARQPLSPVIPEHLLRDPRSGYVHAQQQHQKTRVTYGYNSGYPASTPTDREKGPKQGASKASPILIEDVGQASSNSHPSVLARPPDVAQAHHGNMSPKDIRADQVRPALSGWDHPSSHGSDPSRRAQNGRAPISLEERHYGYPNFSFDSKPRRTGILPEMLMPNHMKWNDVPYYGYDAYEVESRDYKPHQDARHQSQSLQPQKTYLRILDTLYRKYVAIFRNGRETGART